MRRSARLLNGYAGSTDDRRNGASRASPFSGRTAWARSLRTPLQQFLRTETGGADVLLGAALAALTWVNVHPTSYESLWETSLSIEIGGAGVSLPLREWVNSGLMTFVFFVLGLEARREFDLGELRARRLAVRAVHWRMRRRPGANHTLQTALVRTRTTPNPSEE